MVSLPLLWGHLWEMDKDGNEHQRSLLQGRGRGGSREKEMPAPLGVSQGGASLPPCSGTPTWEQVAGEQGWRGPACSTPNSCSAIPCVLFIDTVITRGPLCEVGLDISRYQNLTLGMCIS